MLHHKTVGVVVPAYNEEQQIGMVISSMPNFVDKIVIVNDCSLDKTAEIVQQHITQDAGDTMSINSVQNNITPNKRLFTYPDHRTFPCV